MTTKPTLHKSVMLTVLIFTFAGALAKAQLFNKEFEQALKAKVALAAVESNLKLDNRQEHFQMSFPASDVIENNRVYRTVTLNHSGVDTAQLLISAPLDFEKGRQLPVVFISAGFFSGMNTIRLLKSHNDLILVGYEYPTNLDAVKKDPSLLPKAMRVVPGQLALGLEWLTNQTWAKSNNIHVVGVSLGTLFFPVALKLAEKRGFVPRSTSFLFGGAQPRPVLENLLQGQIANDVLGTLLKITDVLTAPYDPQLYLPLLRGPFLTIYGSNDQVFPKFTSQQQFFLLPEPKETYEVQGKHIDVTETALIEETTRILDDFIQRQL